MLFRELLTVHVVMSVCTPLYCTVYCIGYCVLNSEYSIAQSAQYSTVQHSRVQEYMYVW